MTKGDDAEDREVQADDEEPLPAKRLGPGADARGKPREEEQRRNRQPPDDVDGPQDQAACGDTLSASSVGSGTATVSSAWLALAVVGGSCGGRRLGLPAQRPPRLRSRHKPATTIRERMQSSSLASGATRNSATAYIMGWRTVALLESPMPRGGRFFRDNAFLVAAFALPVAVVLLFLAGLRHPALDRAPARLRPGPARSRPVRPGAPHQRGVRGPGRPVEAIVRPLPVSRLSRRSPRSCSSSTRRMNVREIPVPLPATMAENDPPQTIVVEALAGRRVLAQAQGARRLRVRTCAHAVDRAWSATSSA